MLCGLMKYAYDVIIKDTTISVSCNPETFISLSDWDDPADVLFQEKIKMKSYF